MSSTFTSALAASQTVEQFRGRHSVLVGRHLELVVANPGEGQRIEQPPQHTLLPHQDGVVDRIVLAVRPRGTPVKPPRGDELAEKFRRERERLRGEHPLLEQIEGRPLRRGVHDAEGGRSVRVAAVAP